MNRKRGLLQPQKIPLTIHCPSHTHTHTHPLTLTVHMALVGYFIVFSFVTKPGQTLEFLLWGTIVPLNFLVGYHCSIVASTPQPMAYASSLPYMYIYIHSHLNKYIIQCRHTYRKVCAISCFQYAMQNTSQCLLTDNSEAARPPHNLWFFKDLNGQLLPWILSLGNAMGLRPIADQSTVESSRLSRRLEIQKWLTVASLNGKACMCKSLFINDCEVVKCAGILRSHYNHVSQ